ncbi:cell division protein ZapC [Shewanella yunxiaonensis]|uniref:Cell division protein ZapC n=1 Tax=Shewanella yunxiaonensis TaxID=2829809 RepID=A0ABX7YPG0_9GAMM|nr:MULTISPECIES: cell division protein ZapC [Shewanella]MDF0535296.1 cell division protein ZapC [Shewanella sp. A32]QUN04540.1 cell division protein ZapC [Shewanella yunxiaonensis]
MLLMPESCWQWKYDDSYGVLGITLGSELEFLTPYKSKTLIPDALSEFEFNVDHARYYIELLDCLSKRLSLPDACLVQLALNATAARFLQKPQMPKSWFFESSDVCVYSEAGKLFNVKCRGERILVLVIETNLQASTVMMLDQECMLSDTKSLQKFETIKVMHDRLFALRAQQQIVAA